MTDIEVRIHMSPAAAEDFLAATSGDHYRMANDPTGLASVVLHRFRRLIEVALDPPESPYEYDGDALDAAVPLDFLMEELDD